MIFSWLKKKLFKSKDGLIALKSGEYLLLQHKGLIDRIFLNSKTTEHHWNTLYLPALIRLAAYSQQLPASQNHHHAFAGGFLLHTLEVINYALIDRNNRMLPIGATVEKQNDKKDVWSYAIFTSALLHDVGKIANDVYIILYDKKRKKLGRWTIWLGNLATKDAKYYSYQYKQIRKYMQHSLIASTLMTKFIPASGIDWLQQESELFTMFLLNLQGRHSEAGVIATIISASDSQSCSDSLADTPNPSINDPTQPVPKKSLADKLLNVMRYIVLETNIKINQPGAPIFTDNDNIYFVSKAMLDAMKKQLQKDKQTGIPYNNSRLMDELLQFNIVTKNDKGKAIWKINLSQGGFKKEIQLTVLLLPISTIYNNNQIPTPFAGTLTVEGKVEPKIVVHKVEPKIPEPVVHKVEPKVIKVDTNTGEILNPDELSTDEKQAVEEIEFALPPGFNNEQEVKEDADPAPVTLKPDIDQKTTLEQDNIYQTNTNDHGKAFINWLTTGLNNHSIETNHASAQVHLIKEGLFIVSPAIFKAYDSINWHTAQNQLTTLNITAKTKTNQNIWTIQPILYSKDKKPSKIKGYLIPDPTNILKINVALELNTKVKLSTQTKDVKQIKPKKNQSINKDALAALKKLGFKTGEATLMLKKVDNTLPVTEIIKSSLILK